ncbi:MAG: NAD(+) synthase [Peptococcaceae bacterium]
MGFVKVAAASPKLKVANPQYNIGEIEKLIREAVKNEAALMVFPELSITGYTCADLFHQQKLLSQALCSLEELVDKTKDTEILVLVGLPLIIDAVLYNCTVAFQQGKLLAVVPKMFIPNYKEFYEKRWFTSGSAIAGRKKTIKLLAEDVPFGHVLLTSSQLGFTLGIEVCEDLWAPIPPSSYQVLTGANIIANLSASNELVAKSEYRRQLITQQSARALCGYVYASAGVYESTTDMVFGGECLIAENGNVLKASPRFVRDNVIIYSEIDTGRLAAERQLYKTFGDAADHQLNVSYQIKEVFYTGILDIGQRGLTRVISPTPFIPANPVTVHEHCEEIFNIQVAGLAKRIEHTGLSKAVIGVSGGLDSALALLVASRTFNVLKIPAPNIIAVTMPGFGTTDKTYENALILMNSLKTTIKEISIKEACLQHFKDISHNPLEHDITYENSQARERTQILMDIANKEGGLVIGTGDLSEYALGWSTYNGDHMSMYGVNNSIPKTLVRFLIKWVAENVMDHQTRKVLQDIIDTPISPELLPPDLQGRIRQKTEDVVGPYELHDFFIYYVVRFGMEPKKVLFLARQAYGDKYCREELKKWLGVFYQRFFSQQFKRSCMPDGPKVGTVSFSPRGDWRMPSDGDVRIWLTELENS